MEIVIWHFYTWSDYGTLNKLYFFFVFYTWYKFTQASIAMNTHNITLCHLPTSPNQMAT